MKEGCGALCWHPKWLQKFANSRSFMVVYGLLGTIQAMGYLYFVVTLTTIEKRFKIPSQTTGIILSGNEVSQILLSLILSYAGGQRNRPRWIAWGVVFCSISCFILALPHFIYGAGEEALQLTQEYLTEHKNETSEIFLKAAQEKKNSKLCRNAAPLLDECDEVFSYLPLVLIFLSQFVLGIGNTLYYSLGQSYLDDNTRKTNTPLMLAYALSLRMFGPVIGFALGYFSLNIYIDPTRTPLITSDDPRWLGAWWFGWIILGSLMFLFAALIGMFPKTLPKKQKQLKCVDTEKHEGKSEHGDADGAVADIKNFPKALMRLLTNKLLMYNNASTVFYLLGSSGFITFLSRIMEVQFGKSSAGGTIFTGPLTILGMVGGFILSGYMISKYKPTPKYLFFWNVIVGMVSMCGQTSYMNLGCDGNSLIINGSLPSMISCNTNCSCDGITYTPVCDKYSGETYFSPCHAGCKDFDVRANTYSSCECSNENYIQNSMQKQEIATEIAMEKALVLNETKQMLERKSWPDINVDIVSNKTIQSVPIDDDDLYDEEYDDSQEHYEDPYRGTHRRKRREIKNSIVPGPCVGDCTYAYYTFSIISLVVSLLSSTGRIGNVLLNFRAVEPRDKAFAQGLALFLVSLLALIPGPIIFGRIIDSTCLIWNYKCGERGNCQLYDPLLFRYYLHATAAGLTLIGVLFDVLVWHCGKKLDLYGVEDNKKPIKTEDLAESEPLKN